VEDSIKSRARGGESSSRSWRGRFGSAARSSEGAHRRLRLGRASRASSLLESLGKGEENTGCLNRLGSV
jgi:hypothetical protein